CRDRRLTARGHRVRLGSLTGSSLDRVGFALTALAGGVFAVAILLGALNAVRSEAHGIELGLLRRVLPLVGPVVVFIGMELVPHAVGPCTVMSVVGGPDLPAMCERITHGSGFGGKGEPTTSVDVIARWHALMHGLIGAVPMTLLYRFALKKWRPHVLGAG
ncbi:MAG TPA: hypothetical protein VNA87_04145, partial [Actinomycetota bacterium]|nr:hypothetical protein [Actinomycetota bacterium]